MTARRLDTIGWFICTLHQALGHRQAAAFLGQDPGDASQCILCRYDKGQVEKAEVIEQMGVELS